MFWIFMTALLLGITFAILKVGFIPEKSGYSSHPEINLKPFATIPFVLWLFITLFSSFNTIEAGQIGLVRTFGEFTGQQSPGLNFKAPYQSVTEVDGRILKRRINMTGGEKGSAVSKETQPVYAQLEINYRVQLDKARTLYTDVGETYYSRIIEPRVQQAFKAETVKYKTIEIAPQREEIREAVRKALDKSLDEYGIDVTALTIRDLDFGKKFMDAIEDKQAATEQAKAAAEKVAITKAEADSAREKAKGAADSAVIAARGEAQSINIKGEALRRNPDVIELTAVEKINPTVQTIVLPPNSPLLQLPAAK